MKLGRVRYLRTDSEYNEYIERAYEKIGVRFPLEYLKNNRTIGFFNSNGKLSGGYAFILNGPLRVVESLPEEALEKFKAVVGSEDQVFELTGLWMDRNEVSGPMCAWLWTRMYWESVKTQRPYILYAYSASKPKLGKTYQVAQPIEIFRGETKLLKGMDEVDVEVIEVAAMKNVHRAWITQPQFLLKRIFRRSATKQWVSAESSS